MALSSPNPCKQWLNSILHNYYAKVCLLFPKLFGLLNGLYNVGVNRILPETNSNHMKGEKSMKKKMRKLIGLMMACIVLTMSTLPVYAKGEKPASVEEVFPESKVKELKKLADEKPILPDKVANGTSSTQSLKSVNKYPTRKGVILISLDKSNGQMGLIGHAAVVYNDAKVVEALMQGNAEVTTGPNDWYASKIDCTAVTVYGTSMEQDAEVAEWCHKQLGKPYNFNFLDVDTRDSFYCSQLVWAAYKDCHSIDLNTTHSFLTAVLPVELDLSSRTYRIYEKEH